MKKRSKQQKELWVVNANVLQFCCVPFAGEQFVGVAIPVRTTKALAFFPKPMRELGYEHRSVPLGFTYPSKQAAYLALRERLRSKVVRAAYELAALSEAPMRLDQEIASAGLLKFERVRKALCARAAKAARSRRG